MGADLELVVGGRPVRFPAVWLRDNCPCPDCLAPGTGQKLKDITDIPNGLAITRTENAGIQRRGFCILMCAMNDFPAKAISPTSTSSCSPRNTAAEARPETTIAASMAASTINNKLLVVFSAAMPITMATPR